MDANSQCGCANLLFTNFFLENCMKVKEMGPRGCVPGALLDQSENSQLESLVAAMVICLRQANFLSKTIMRS